jgi:hypothetical protein
MGNEEYEYKGNKKEAGERQHIRHRRGTNRTGGVALAVALRHVVERKTAGQTCQLFFYEKFSELAIRAHLDG